MPEPLSEDVEESWLVFLNRFDAEIYPTLFAPRGYTKGEALLAWSIGRLEAEVDGVRQAVEEKL